MRCSIASGPCAYGKWHGRAGRWCGDARGRSCGSQSDGELSAQAFNVHRAFRRQRGGGLVQRRIERRLDLRSLQGLQQVAAEHQGHQLRRGQRQRQRLAVAVHQAPDRLAVPALGDERDMGRLQGLQITPNGAGMARKVLGQGCRQLLQGRAARALQSLQQKPLARDLVVAWHGYLVVSELIPLYPPGPSSRFPPTARWHG